MQVFQLEAPLGYQLRYCLGKVSKLNCILILEWSLSTNTHNIFSFCILNPIYKSLYAKITEEKSLPYYQCIGQPTYTYVGD